jgi:Na+/citrate or Na+/malate symporter
MRRLWHDFQAHQWAAVLLLLYWLATLAVILMTWDRGIPDRIVVLLFTTPLIAGVLVGRWRASTPERAVRSRDRITGGMLAGVLSAEITLLVMKGGVVDEVIGWTRGHGFQGVEVLEFCIATGVLGVLLGLAGAVLAMISDRVRRQDRPAPSN